MRLPFVLNVFTTIALQYCVSLLNPAGELLIFEGNINYEVFVIYFKSLRFMFCASTSSL